MNGSKLANVPSASKSREHVGYRLFMISRQSREIPGFATPLPTRTPFNGILDSPL